MSRSNIATFGLLMAAHAKIKCHREDQHRRDPINGCRFPMVLALARGAEPPEFLQRTTTFSVVTVDPAQTVERSIECLMGERFLETSARKMAERPAECGVNKFD